MAERAESEPRIQERGEKDREERLREDPTKMRECTWYEKRRKIDRGRQRELRGFKPKEFLAHANQRFAGVGEERRDCTS